MPSNVRKIIEQAKYLKQVEFEKQVKIIEDQGQKQIKVLEEHGKQLIESNEFVKNNFNIDKDVISLEKQKKIN